MFQTEASKEVSRLSPAERIQDMLITYLNELVAHTLKPKITTFGQSGTEIRSAIESFDSVEAYLRDCIKRTGRIPFSDYYGLISARSADHLESDDSLTNMYLSIPRANSGGRLIPQELVSQFIPDMYEIAPRIYADYEKRKAEGRLEYFGEAPVIRKKLPNGMIIVMNITPIHGLHPSFQLGQAFGQVRMAPPMIRSNSGPIPYTGVTGIQLISDAVAAALSDAHN